MESERRRNGNKETATYLAGNDNYSKEGRRVVLLA
jgi:hypothetical protein